MTASSPRKKAPHLKPVRIVRAHIKLFAAAVLGVVLFLALPDSLHAASRALIAWNVAVGLYLVVAAYVISQFELSWVRRRTEEEDEGGAWILALTVASAAASLVAIFVELGDASGKRAGLFSALLALSTVVLSWFFIHVIFAFHYAHEFYGEAKDGHRGGLKFPADDQPEYWDFVYFSFAIGTTSQVTDVLVTSKAMRRLVVGHGVVSFFYNVAVLALMVSLGGEFIKG
ncbi:MAG: DUF1345 domain-containing protein [Xanthobacteraceae bacterium]|nr:DUF1345 domain-containing protein [Xanthobacteraceae bacterium]